MLHHLLYLHGFRSSPLSYKAQHLSEIFKNHYPSVQWVCPQLPPSPKDAAELILELTPQWDPKSSAVIGSSLGGFYANWLANQRGFRSILINPATDPARDLRRYIGHQKNWQNPNDSFYFKEQYLAELMSLYPVASHISTASKAQKLLMACKGDEVLDWREMVETHQGATQYIIEGSNHAMSDFDQHLGVLLKFLGLHSNPN